MLRLGKQISWDRRKKFTPTYILSLASGMKQRVKSEFCQNIKLRIQKTKLPSKIIVKNKHNENM